MFRRTRGAAVVALLIVGGASRAAAQTCTGFTAIDESHRGRVGAALALSSHTAGVYADFAAGSTLAFGSFQIGRTHYRDLAFSTTVAGGALSGQVPLHSSRKVWACPGVAYSAEWGTISDFGIDVSSSFTTGGVDVGAIVMSSGDLDVVPTFSVAGGRLRSSQTDSTGTTSGRDTGGVVTLGVGLIVKHRITVHPALNVPFGLVGAEKSFTVTATVSFGNR